MPSQHKGTTRFSELLALRHEYSTLLQPRYGHSDVRQGTNIARVLPSSARRDGGEV